MFNFLGGFMKSIAKMCANVNSVACAIWIIDEPEAPASIIEK